MVAREAPVKSNKFCLTDVLNMSAQLFSLLLLPLPSLFSPEAQSRPSNAVMFLLNNSSCCNSSFQYLQSSSNAWEKGTMKDEEQLLHLCFFPFLQRINLLPPVHSFSWTLWIYLLLFRQMGKGSRMRREYL